MVVLSATALSPCFAQSKLAFDVASVKPGGPVVPGSGNPMRGGPGTDDPGRITWTRVMLQDVFTRAYGVRDDQISAPAWINNYDLGDSNRYTITAIMPKETTAEQFQVMLQNLLVERFHVVVHHETRDFPGYELTMAPGGPKLKLASPEDKAEPSRPPGMLGRDANGFPIRRPGSPVARVTPGPGMWGMIRSSNRMSMTQFTADLGGMVNESNGVKAGTPIPRVVDKTGLTEDYEFTLGYAGLFTPPASVARMYANAMAGLAAEMAAMRPAGSGAVDTAPGEVGPTLFTALEQQLGLRLQKTRNAPVDIIVIDHIDKVPAED